MGKVKIGVGNPLDSELQAPIAPTPIAAFSTSPFWASTNTFASKSSQPFVTTNTTFPNTRATPSLSSFSTHVNPFISSHKSHHPFYTASSNYPWSSKPKAPTPPPSAHCFSSSKGHFQDFTSKYSIVVSSMPALTSNLRPSSLVPSSSSVPSNYVKFPQISTTTSTSFTVPPQTWSTTVTPLVFQSPLINTSQSGQPSQGEASKEKACVSSCFHINVDSIEFEEEEVSQLMPKLENPEYYTEPSIEELEANKKTEPGFCSRVKDFVIGRNDKGSIKFLEEIDLRKLDLESIFQFNDREVIVYVNATEKPPVGKGLNGPAEITLLNVKCIGKTTGKQYTDGPQVQRYKTALIKKSAEVGVEFVSYERENGESEMGGSWSGETGNRSG